MRLQLLLLLVPSAVSASTLCFEAELANELSYPFEITELEDASGGLAITIPEGAGSRAAFGEKDTGFASYFVRIPEEGEYSVRMRAQWNGNCSNSAMLKIGQAKPVQVSTKTFGVWHWVFAGSGIWLDQIMISREDVELGPGPVKPDTVPRTDATPRPEPRVFLSSPAKGIQALPPTDFRLTHATQRVTPLPALRTLVLADQDPRAKFLLAQVNFEQKRFEEAGRLLEECYAQEKGSSRQLANIAKKLAELHAARGTLPQFIAETGGPVDGATVDDTDQQRKQFLLLSHLFEENGQFVDACETYLSYCDLQEKKSQRDWRLGKLLRPAVHQLLGQGQTTEATKLVLLLRDKGFAGPWLDCTDYVILDRTGQKEKAAALFEKLEAETGTTEAEVFTLISAFEDWGRLDLCAKFCHRTLELKPDNSVYDSNAHIRLGRLYMQEGKFTEAQEHFDAVDASLTGRNMGIIGMEHFRRMEVYVRLRAAKDDPAVLVRLLDDPRPGRQLAAAQYLSQYGRTEQLAELQTRLDQGSPKLRAALQEAITNIRARGAAPAPVAKMLSDDELKELLGPSGKLLWLKTDPFAPHLRWASLEKKFVSIADVKRGFIGSFSDAMEVLSDSPLTASAIAFTEQTVWVGTDHGLFVLQRKQQTWNGYAVGGKFVDVAVKDLRVEKNSVVVDIEREGRRERYGLTPATGEWKKLSTGGEAGKE